MADAAMAMRSPGDRGARRRGAFASGGAADGQQRDRAGHGGGRGGSEACLHAGDRLRGLSVQPARREHAGQPADVFVVRGAPAESALGQGLLIDAIIKGGTGKFDFPARFDTGVVSSPAGVASRRSDIDPGPARAASRRGTRRQEDG